MKASRGDSLQVIAHHNRFWIIPRNRRYAGSICKAVFYRLFC